MHYDFWDNLIQINLEGKVSFQWLRWTTEFREVSLELNSPWKHIIYSPSHLRIHYLYEDPCGRASRTGCHSSALRQEGPFYTACTQHSARVLGTGCSQQQGGPFPRDTHQVNPKQESLHCLSVLLIDGLRAATKKIAQRVHRACWASDTPGNPQLALVFLYLILFSCPTRSVSPVCKQLTFMPVMHCYRCRVIAYEEINHIICKPRPFLPFPKLCWLFRKKKKKACIVPSPWLFALALQMLTPITYCGF